MGTSLQKLTLSREDAVHRLVKRVRERIEAAFRWFSPDAGQESLEKITGMSAHIPCTVFS